jgi:hypothetical protein
MGNGSRHLPLSKQQPAVASYTVHLIANIAFIGWIERRTQPELDPVRRLFRADTAASNRLQQPADCRISSAWEAFFHSVRSAGDARGKS